jgi:hypothetical protein
MDNSTITSMHLRGQLLHPESVYKIHELAWLESTRSLVALHHVALRLPRQIGRLLVQLQPAFGHILPRPGIAVTDRSALFRLLQ